MTAGKVPAGAARAASITPSPRAASSSALNAVLKRSGRTADRTLPPHKVRIVQIAKRQVGMADEVYRATLLELGGVDTSTKLSQAGFEAVMLRFVQLGFVHTNPFPPRGAPEQPAPEGMATAQQRKYIRGLWRKWHGSDDGRALRRWLEGRYHVTDLRFATVGVARMAIEGLKAMVNRKRLAGAATSKEGNPE